MLKVIDSESATTFAQLYNEHIKPLYLNAVSPSSKEQYSEDMTPEGIKENMNNSYSYLFFEEDWITIGWLYYKHKDEITIYIWWYYIFKQEDRNQWYGQKMLHEIEQFVLEQKIKHILLETNPSFTWAINFYAKNWFSLLTNDNLANSYYGKFYTKLVDHSVMFYKELA